MMDEKRQMPEQNDVLSLKLILAAPKGWFHNPYIFDGFYTCLYLILDFGNNMAKNENQPG